MELSNEDRQAVSQDPVLRNLVREAEEHRKAAQSDRDIALKYQQQLTVMLEGISGVQKSMDEAPSVFESSSPTTTESEALSVMEQSLNSSLSQVEIAREVMEEKMASAEEHIRIS